MTDEAITQARAIVKQFYPEMPADYSGRRVQIALVALNAANDAPVSYTSDYDLQVSNLVSALEGLLELYTGLVNCGDCGNWDCETEDEVIAARAALAAFQEASQ